MNRPNQYEWLIIAEGNSDITIYRKYLSDGKFNIRGTRGKNTALNMRVWEHGLISILHNDLGRVGFKGVIIVVDSDSDSTSPFKDYCRGEDSLYVGSKLTPARDPTGTFWILDILKGIKELPVRGVNVPRAVPGCLETDLLRSYGFPIKPQSEYDAFVDIIKQATVAWNIPKKGDGNPWWEDNEEAKMDKFMYSALLEGFEICATKPVLPMELDIIKNIRMAAS